MQQYCKSSPEDARVTYSCADRFKDEEIICEAGALDCFHNCVNINECGDVEAGNEATQMCSCNTECRDIEILSPTDVPFGYACDCNDGYEALSTNDDGEYVSSDIDECTTADVGKMHNCDSRNADTKATSECHDLEGDYECVCLGGFSNANRDGCNSTTQSGHICENEDQCQKGTFNACREGPLVTYTADSPVSCSDNDFTVSNDKFTCTYDVGYESLNH